MPVLELDRPSGQPGSNPKPSYALLLEPCVDWMKEEDTDSWLRWEKLLKDERNFGVGGRGGEC